MRFAAVFPGANNTAHAHTWYAGGVFLESVNPAIALLPWVPEVFFFLLFAAKIERRSCDRDEREKNPLLTAVTHLTSMSTDFELGRWLVFEFSPRPFGVIMI